MGDCTSHLIPLGVTLRKRYDNYDSNIDELFRALGWRKLKYQRLESAAIMKYKSLHGMTPECLSSRFVSRNYVTS